MDGAFIQKVYTLRVSCMQLSLHLGFFQISDYDEGDYSKSSAFIPRAYRQSAAPASLKFTGNILEQESALIMVQFM